MKLVNRVAARAAAASRRTKITWILDRLQHDDTVLLVGAAARRTGLDVNQVEAAVAESRHAVAVIYEAPVGALGLACPVVRADARSLPFRADAFDVVFSNAVIEHVGGPRGARQMVAESARVARRLAVHTTPNRWFPVETHTLVPLVHWLPRRYAERAMRRLGRSFPPEHYYLYGKRELARFGGSCTRISYVSLALALDG